MSININNFEEHINGFILEMGRYRYNGGAVISVDEISERKYSAGVEGPKFYNVYAEIDENGNITDTDCDCSYDRGAYCKHQAALFFALREKLSKTAVKSPGHHTRLEDLIGNCKKEQLVEIILKHAEEDSYFREYLKIKLSDEKNTDINKLIAELTKFARTLYIEGYDSRRFELLVEKAEKTSALDRVHIYSKTLYIFENGIDEYLNYVYGDRGYEIYEYLGEVSDNMSAAAEELVKSGDMKAISKGWEYLSENRKVENDYDEEDRFFPSFLKFSSLPDYRRKLEQLILDSDDHSSDTKDDMLFRIISDHGTKDEQEKFINSHLENDKFRMLAIDRAIENNDHALAEKLACDGITLSKDKWGMKTDYKKKLYEIYSKSGDNEKLKETCRSLTVDGCKDYYGKWKSLLTDDVREKEIQRIVNEKHNGSYEYIITEEKMTDRIYELCSENTYKIAEYYRLLKGTAYENIGRKLYEGYILGEAEKANQRSSYAEVCGKLKAFSRECGKEPAAKIAESFRKSYNRRPAFIDEINKAGF